MGQYHIVVQDMLLRILYIENRTVHQSHIVVRGMHLHSLGRMRHSVGHYNRLYLLGKHTSCCSFHPTARYNPHLLYYEKRDAPHALRINPLLHLPRYYDSLFLFGRMQMSIHLDSFVFRMYSLYCSVRILLLHTIQRLLHHHLHNTMLTHYLL